MGLDERAVPSWTSGPWRQPRTCIVAGLQFVISIEALAARIIDKVSVTLAEPSTIRTVLGKDLEIEFGTEVKQPFETYPVKVFVADS